MKVGLRVHPLSKGFSGEVKWDSVIENGDSSRGVHGCLGRYLGKLKLRDFGVQYFIAEKDKYRRYVTTKSIDKK